LLLALFFALRYYLQPYNAFDFSLRSLKMRSEIQNASCADRRSRRVYYIARKGKEEGRKESRDRDHGGFGSFPAAAKRRRRSPTRCSGSRAE